MAEKVTRRRTYALSPQALIGCCLTALGRMRADVERQDLEHGTIVATIGRGALAPVSELSLTVALDGAGRAHLAVAWCARRMGGDRAILSAFLESVDSLARGA